MKTYRNSILMAAAIAAIAFIPSAQAADQVKGATKLLELTQVKTVAEVEELKPDDTFVMVCSKCKTVYVKKVTQGLKGAQLLGGRGRGGQVEVRGGQRETLVATHDCAGCKSTIEVTGHGRAREVVLKHSCKECGDESVFCCATKPGSGSTEGMEKN